MAKEKKRVEGTRPNVGEERKSRKYGAKRVKRRELTKLERTFPHEKETNQIENWILDM